MGLSWSAFLSKQVKTSIILLIISNPSWADHEHEHSHAPTFSNPEVLSQVPANWDDLPYKHDDVHADADLVVALGQQSYPLFHELVLEYATKNKLKIAVLPGTCGITSGRLRKKSADIGAFCCPPSQSDRLPGLEFHSLGISPIALIVHPDNPLTDISTRQAREVFQGQISRWTQVDNKEKGSIQDLIKPVARLHCKVRPGHWRGLLKDEDQFSPRLFEVGVIADMISQVSHNTGAIGFEVPVMVSYYKDKGIVRMLKIDGHDATDLDYVLSGKYPLYRSYSLTTWKKNSKSDQLAMKLVRYLQQHVEKIHKEISYIPPSQLRKAGWVFNNDELIGEPKPTAEKK
jgi:ABC-type phosphate transport system substrate-binding protein